MPYDAIFSSLLRTCQIAKHILCNILETNHYIDAKPTEPFILNIIKLLIEKSIRHGSNSLILAIFIV